MMVHILVMPRQGNTVESCIIGEYKVREGDTVEPDTIVCVVETDKATFEIPAGAGGTVLKILYQAGDDVPVLQPIMVVGNPGESWEEALRLTPSAGGAESAGEVAVPAAAPTAESDIPVVEKGEGGRIASSPRARALAQKEAVDLAALRGAGPEGRIIEADVAAAAARRGPLTAAAKEALREKGIGTADGVQGTGPGGRIRAVDILSRQPASAEAGGPPGVKAPGAASAVVPSGQGAVTETPIKGIRKLIAERMLKSLAESAQLTLNSGAPATRMQELRARMKGEGEALGLSRVTVNDLILFAVSRVLPLYPFMNAHKIGDVLRTFERVHLGMAVDTPRGLMVPVIRNANLLSLGQISAEAKRLASAAQGGTISPDELSGSTFTVTNLGSLGVNSFTPILNAPEVGILGVGSIELKPVAAPLAAPLVKKEMPGPETWGFDFEPHIAFSLTINHQVVDGAPGARFLKALGEAVANIDLWLING
jgi:pyruvate dehydrogenase E2 component (dihydrolipoamide acetyltransferase)